MSGPRRSITEPIPASLDGERLDRVVSMLADQSRSKAETLVADGHVRVDGEVVRSRAFRLAEGSEIQIEVDDAPILTEPVPDDTVELSVVLEDEHLAVLDKQAGLVVHPGSGRSAGTLVNGLLARFPEVAGVGGDPTRPGIVHRLDRDTSGLMVVARTPEAHAALVAALSAREVERGYVALVWGAFESPRGMVDAPIGRSPRRRDRMAVVGDGRPARTRYEVRTEYVDPVGVTLLDCSLETGRTHQIRVHLNAIGHPVVGDEWYAGVRENLQVPRLFLHASNLAFTHPITAERVELASPLPPELREVLAGLG